MKQTLILITTLLIFFNANSQTDTIKTSIEKIDSSIQVRTAELQTKNNQIKDASSQLDEVTQKIANINSRIQSLVLKQNKTQQDYKNLQAKYDSLDIAINEKLSKIKSLDSLITLKDSTSKNLDTSIKRKDFEIEAKSKRVDSIKQAGDSIQKVENETIEKRQSLISKQLDSLEVIASIAMRDSLNVFYLNSNNRPVPSAEKYKIKEVNLTVKEGIILEIIVRTTNGVFRNKKNIIDLVHLGDNFIDSSRGRLYKENQKYDRNANTSFVFLDDVIDYNVIRSYSDVAYGDFDIKLLPTADANVYLLRESTSINSYFSVAGFTDIKGLSGEANGLAQFAAEAKFITHTKNIKGTANVLWNYLAFQGGLSKFDNDFKGTKIYNEDSVSRKDLLQRSSYGVGIKMNLVKGFNSPAPKHLFSDIQLNVGYNFLGSKIYDTVFKAAAVIDTAFRTITQNQIYVEPVATIDRHRNFSITLSAPLSFISVKKSALLSNDGWECWIRPSISLMYFGKRDPGSKMFFRYNHYINLNHPTQAFTQMQLGFSINLTQAWSNQAK